MLGIDGLLGKDDDSLVNLLGLLCRNPSNVNEFVLEDGEGRVVLDLSESVCVCDEVNDRNSRVVTFVRE